MRNTDFSLQLTSSVLLQNFTYLDRQSFRVSGIRILCDSLAILWWFYQALLVIAHKVRTPSSTQACPTLSVHDSNEDLDLLKSGGIHTEILCGPVHIHHLSPAHYWDPLAKHLDNVWNVTDCVVTNELHQTLYGHQRSRNPCAGLRVRTCRIRRLTCLLWTWFMLVKPTFSTIALRSHLHCITSANRPITTPSSESEVGPWTIYLGEVFWVSGQSPSARLEDYESTMQD